jgi:hypothetical protein
VLGREAEIDALVTVLLRKYKPNPLIIGESGVGKTALVEGLAQRILDGTVSPPLRDSRIFEVRLSELAAGTAAHGAMEERLRALFRRRACPTSSSSWTRCTRPPSLRQRAHGVCSSPPLARDLPRIGAATGPSTTATWSGTRPSCGFQVILPRSRSGRTRTIMDGVAARLAATLGKASPRRWSTAAQTPSPPPDARSSRTSHRRMDGASPPATRAEPGPDEQAIWTPFPPG